MQYHSLHELLAGSTGSRKYFLSRTEPVQNYLYQHSSHIHSAADLHTYADVIEKYVHAAEVSEMLFKPPRTSG